MLLKPEELQDKGYILLDQLDHSEMVPFIREYMKKRTKTSTIYNLLNLILFGIAGYLFIKGYSSPEYSFINRFVQFSYGLALALALLPLHEYIHVLAYRSQGAKDTSYASNIRKFYFMALADKFVADRREFRVVALSPFISISALLLIALFFVNQNWTLTILATLLAHTAMCSGDFGLVSYFEFHKDKKVVTYDDVENKRSYFYGH